MSAKIDWKINNKRLHYTETFFALIFEIDLPFSIFIKLLINLQTIQNNSSDASLSIPRERIKVYGKIKYAKTPDVNKNKRYERKKKKKKNSRRIGINHSQSPRCDRT